MAQAKEKATGKEKDLASKVMQRVMARKSNECVPLDCEITIKTCAYLVTCDPMTCGGLQCDSLKKV